MSSWERYWIAGYTVHGGPDVIVERYCRSREEAIKKATAAAGDDIVRLETLGIGAEVVIWITAWRTRRVEEREDQETVDTILVARQTETRELSGEDR